MAKDVSKYAIFGCVNQDVPWTEKVITYYM